jgi:hypothetical protein
MDADMASYDLAPGQVPLARSLDPVVIGADVAQIGPTDRRSDGP